MNEALVMKDLGALDGPLLVFGGVYSNLPALEKLIAIAEALRLPPSQVICTGDIVGYCAQPEECVQHIQDWGIHAIAGNVEIQLRNREDDCGCNFNEGSRCDLFSRRWYPYAQAHLSERSLEWMQTLPHHLRFSYGGKRAYVLHGSVANPSEFIFRSTPWAVKQANFQAAGADLILAGHCGLPFQQQQEEQHWLNAGVIGMPANDGTPRVWYLLLNTAHDQLQYEHQAFFYDHEQAAASMEARQLPREYSETLRTGLWDNCEILPPVETAAQGQAMIF